MGADPKGNNPNELYRRAKKIFLASLEIEPAEREQFLAAAAAGNPSLQDQVRALWRAEEDFTDTATSASAGPEPPLPTAVGSFQILERLGGGGMGTVFLAQDPHNNREVALKVIHAGAMGTGLHQRFQREATIIGQLDHPGIVRLYEAGVEEAEGGDVAYLAMEHVRGCSLDQYCAKTPFQLQDRLKILAAISRAVAHAHERGIVHRDLKPSNILVDEDARPRVLDFGISRLINPSETLPTLTVDSSHLIGTVKYMSPEMAQGAEATFASDIYALGLIIHTVLAGEFPYPVPEFPLHQALLAVIAAKPTPPSRQKADLGPAVDAVVAHCLAPDPQQRYADAQTLAEDLEALPVGNKLHVDVPGPASRLLGKLRTGVPRTPLRAVGMLLLGLLGWFFVSYLTGEPAAASDHRHSIYALLDSADNNLHIAPRGHEGYLAAVDSLSQALDLLRQQPDLPEHNALNRYARWRMGEAQYFLGGLEFDPARYKAANRFFKTCGDVPFDDASFAALDSTSVITARIALQARSQAYGGRALAAAALANFVTPRSNYRVAQMYMQSALAQIWADSTAISYRPDAHNQRLNMCLAYNDNGRYRSLWGAAADSLEMVRSSLVWFARSDSIGNIRLVPDAYGSLLRGWGQAQLLVAEMGEDPAALNQAYELFNRACSVQEEAGLRWGFLNSRVLLARAHRRGREMGLHQEDLERDIRALQKLSAENQTGPSPFAGSRLHQELAELFLTRFDQDGTAAWLDQAAEALDRAAEICPRADFVFEAKRRLPTEARLAVRRTRAAGADERSRKVLDQIKQVLAGNLREDDRRLFRILRERRQELRLALQGG
ncbi:hypothetical protein CSB20_12800 [bacterium DOLZORAL124_64_63]|nr:MAG: hypothetical protein CSB20_12800 [bacterium DOLZORAL124_64_63]